MRPAAPQRPPLAESTRVGSPPVRPVLIDVLLTAFNAGATIRSAIESVRQQTVSDIRIIVVDDGSTDATAAILAELALTEPRLLVVTKPNSGITDSLAIGLEHCHAPFIARHDADDLSEPERFQMQLDHFAAHPDCIAVSGRARHIDAAGRPTGHIARMDSPDTADDGWIPAREPHLIQPFLMLRREGLLAAGGYRPLYVAEDSDLCWRLQDIGKMDNIEAILGSYRIHSGGITSASVRNGRIISLCSQLAALSARRRRAGRPDLVFEHADTKAYEAAATFEEFYAIGCRQLDAEEQQRLRVAMAAKMVETCFYRLFEPDPDDCRFIRDAMRNGLSLASPENRQVVSEAIMTTAVRLASKGLFANAFLLLPRTRWPAMLGRLAFRLGLPPTTRDMLKRAARRLES